MKITVIGTGYVGLVVGTCLAEMGNQVLCLDLDLDLDRERVRLLDSGVVPIHEPGLAEMIHPNVSAGASRSRPTYDAPCSTASCSSWQWARRRRPMARPT